MAACLSPYTESFRLNQYTMLELARLPEMTREAMVEDWLERVYGKTTAAAKVGCAGVAPIRTDGLGSDTSSMQDISAGEGGILASRPPTTTETSGPCDVDTTFTERKIYKWRKWATESV